MKNISFLSVPFLVFLLLFTIHSKPAEAQNQNDRQQIFQIKTYHLDSPQQEKTVDTYLEKAYIPALHRADIKPVGVFKPIDQDTTSDRRIYVLIPYESIDRLITLPVALEKDEQYLVDGSSYINAPHDAPPYSYIESTILEAFTEAPRIMSPDLTSPKSERIYELRSYGGATEKINKNKVEMFNAGEVEIFDRLGFNAVFYGDVLSGSEMPNLMYMTTFEDMESRDAHWDSFRNDSQWEELSSMEKYQNNVSWADIYLLYPTEYSDL